MSIYGYASGYDSKDIKHQVAILREFEIPFTNIFVDNLNGLSKAKFNLQKLILKLQYGDTIDVDHFNCLFSSSREIESLIELFEKKNITIYSDNFEFNPNNDIEYRFTIDELARIEIRALLTDFQYRKKIKRKAYQVYKAKTGNHQKRRLTYKYREAYNYLKAHHTYSDTAQRFDISKSTLIRIKHMIEG